MNEYMTQEERTVLPSIVTEASKLSRDDQNKALGWLMCMVAMRKEKGGS